MKRDSDKHNMYDVLRGFPEQLGKGMEIGGETRVNGNFENIVITGIGGSAFVGDVLKCYLGSEANVFVNKDYTMPGFVDKKYLVIVVSYSGNTEEPLYAYKEARKRGCAILGVCSGGKLVDMCKRDGNPVVLVPGDMVTRCALGYLVSSILGVLGNSGVISNKDRDVKETVEELDPGLEKQGMEIAEGFFGKIPVVYSSNGLYCISLGWRQRLNENSKVLAITSGIPDLNHSEVSGFEGNGKNVHAVIFRDKEDDKKIRERIKLTSEIIKRFRGTVEVIDTKGSNRLSRIMSSIHLGNWASYWLAMKRGIDPTKTDAQDYIKGRMQG